MATTEEILKKYGLKFEELTIAERATLAEWTKVLDSGQQTVKTIYGFIKNLRVSVENELDTFRKQTPPTFLSLLALFIPFYGIVKKWYQDEYKLSLEARLRNLLMIEAFMIGPKRARQAVNRAVGDLARSKNDAVRS